MRRLAFPPDGFRESREACIRGRHLATETRRRPLIKNRVQRGACRTLRKQPVVLLPCKGIPFVVGAPLDGVPLWGRGRSTSADDGGNTLADRSKRGPYKIYC